VAWGKNMIFFALFVFCFFAFASAVFILIFYFLVPLLKKNGIPCDSILESHIDLFLLYENETVQRQKTFLESIGVSSAFSVNNGNAVNWNTLYKKIDQTIQSIRKKDAKERTG
jgi:hypothetical protein